MHQQPAHAPFGPNSFSKAGHSLGVSSRISTGAASTLDLELNLDLDLDLELTPALFTAPPK